MSFANLKKNRKNSLERLSQKAREIGKKGNYDDDRYWKFEVDASGNGFAVIRFLPEPAGEEVPFVTIYKHAFKDDRTGKWYIENSRTTLGEPDPVSDANSELWNTGIEANKEIARKRKRNLKYISNILVISDPKNPSNEGKVFLFEYGPRIFSKIEQAMNPPPEFPDETPMNPFDFWEGANFKLKAFTENRQRSYDKSAFEAPSALFDGDEAKLEELYGKLYSLQAEVAPDKFKSYEQLKARFDAVTGNVAPSSQSRATAAAQPSVERQLGIQEEADPPSRSEISRLDDGLDAYADLLAD